MREERWGTDKGRESGGAADPPKGFQSLGRHLLDLPPVRRRDRRARHGGRRQEVASTQEVSRRRGPLDRGQGAGAGSRRRHAGMGAVGRWSQAAKGSEYDPEYPGEPPVTRPQGGGRPTR